MFCSCLLTVAEACPAPLRPANRWPAAGCFLLTLCAARLFLLASRLLLLLLSLLQPGGCKRPSRGSPAAMIYNLESGHFLLLARPAGGRNSLPFRGPLAQQSNAGPLSLSLLTSAVIHSIRPLSSSSTTFGALFCPSRLVNCSPRDCSTRLTAQSLRAHRKSPEGSPAQQRPLSKTVERMSSSRVHFRRPLVEPTPAGWPDRRMDGGTKNLNSSS